MANWNNPTLTSTYTNFVTEVKDRDVEAAVWFEGMSPTNLPTNAKRLNTSTGRFEKWNGTAWVDAVATFTFPALTVAGAATFNGNTTIGDAGTDTLTVNAAATFGAAATFNGNVTLGDASGDTVTVNGTLTFAGAPVLTPGTANGVLFLNGSKVVSAGSALIFDGNNIGLGSAPGANYGSGTVWGGFVSRSTQFNIHNVVGQDFEFVHRGGGGLQFYTDSANKMPFWIRRFAPTYSLVLDENAVVFNGITPQAGSGFVQIMSGGAASSSLGINHNDNATISAKYGLVFQADNTNTIGGRFFTWRIGGKGYGDGTELMTLLSDGRLESATGITTSWRVPRGTTAQRPTGNNGMLRFNTDLGKFEGHNGSSWASVGGGATGGGSDDVFYENGQTVSVNYTITSGKNAMSAGPVTIASGITVTVPSGSTWVVV